MKDDLFKAVALEAKKKGPPKAKEEKVVALNDPPRKWRFTLTRDDNGRLSEILAEAQD